MTAVMQTATGRTVNLATLTPDDVSLIDVAHQLARVNRFGGATERPYSVAAHSVLVSRVLRDAGHGCATQLLGLLHDAHEAYLGDVIQPVQVLAELESPAAAAWLRRSAARVQAVIETALLPPAFYALLGSYAVDIRAAIKRADLRLLATERRDLLRPSLERWPCLDGVAPLPRAVDAAAPGGTRSPCAPLSDWLVAEAVFVETYRALCAQCERSARNVQ